MIHVDNLDIDDWFNQLKENIDIWITDPPYPFSSQNGTGRYNGMYKRFTWNKIDDVIKKMYNKTVEGGRAYIFCNRDGLFNTLASVEGAGFKFLNILIWDKQHFGGGYHWRNQAEYIVYASKGNPKVYVKSRSNIFNYKKPTISDAIPSINYSPTGTSPKPYQIWEDILLLGAENNEICADPFAGSNPMRAAVLNNASLQNKMKEVYTNVYET
jgi:DNA modification methylase